MKILALLSMGTLLCFGSLAQCTDEVKTFRGNRAEFLNSATGEVERTDDSPLYLKVSSAGAQLVHEGDENGVLSGEVEEAICDWKDNSRNGHASFKSNLKDPHGETKKAEISIDKKDGEITVVVHVPDWGKSIRFVAQGK